MIDESRLWAAVHRMEAAAERSIQAAAQLDQAAQRIAFMLEPGYGGSGLRLIELLEDLESGS